MLVILAQLLTTSKSLQPQTRSDVHTNTLEVCGFVAPTCIVFLSLVYDRVNIFVVVPKKVTTLFKF